MISTMRPDIDNIDEYVRNTTARAFAVVASSLGIPSLLPFLKAVCKSKKSWQVRFPAFMTSFRGLKSGLIMCSHKIQFDLIHYADYSSRLGTPASRSCNRLPSSWDAPFYRT